MDTANIESTPRSFKKGQITRRLLLDASSRVFAEHGYINAEISQITGGAGKSIGVFYTYFNNKAEVLESLLEEFLLDMREQVKSPGNAPEQARYVVNVIWDSYKAHAPTLLALTEAATIDSNFAAALGTLRNYAREDFAGMIRTRQSQGLCPGLDPVLTAIALETMLTYCLNEWLGQGLGAFEDVSQERLAFETLSGVIEAVLSSGAGHSGFGKASG